MTLAAAAPVMAASGPPVCVDMVPSQWTTTTSGTPSAGGVYWDPSQANTQHQYPAGFTVNADPQARSTYWATITTTISVQAGRTYEFSIGYEEVTTNKLTATGTFAINGTVKSTITTDTGSSSGTMSATYNATTTGTITVALKVEITSTNPQTSGDDITWTSFCYTKDWTH